MSTATPAAGEDARRGMAFPPPLITWGESLISTGKTL